MILPRLLQQNSRTKRESRIPKNQLTAATNFKTLSLSCTISMLSPLYFILYTIPNLCLHSNVE